MPVAFGWIIVFVVLGVLAAVGKCGECYIWYNRFRPTPTDETNNEESSNNLLHYENL